MGTRITLVEGREQLAPHHEIERVSGQQHGAVSICHAVVQVAFHE